MRTKRALFPSAESLPIALAYKATESALALLQYSRALLRRPLHLASFRLASSRFSMATSPQPIPPPPQQQQQPEASTSALQLEPQPTSKHEKLGGHDWWEAIGKPKYVVAPMVDQSELVSMWYSLMDTRKTFWRLGGAAAEV